MTDTILVLSDLHLAAPGPGRFGIDAAARLDAAIDWINGQYRHAGLVVLAGDLADRSQPEGYARLASALPRLAVPWVATLGNHDDRGAFARTFGAGPGGFAQAHRRVGGTDVIVLDSLDPQPPAGWEGSGLLCDARLAWLDAALAMATGPIVLVQHHPIWTVGLASDRHDALRNADALKARLTGHDVRLAVTGHIHMTALAQRDGLLCATLAGGFSSTREAFGARQGKERRTGPAQMAVVLSSPAQITVHFDSYVDAHGPVT